MPIWPKACAYTVDNASDTINENAAEGFDTINSSVTKTISANVEKLALTGASAINATGGTADDYLLGNTGNNTPTGGVGNDLLNGGGSTGVDTLVGDAGNFDFTGLVSAFDAASAPNNWALMNALLSEHLASSDTEALGGDLAYRYGLSGSLAGIGFDPAVAVMSSGSFGTAAQTLQSTGTLEQGIKRLS